MNRPGVAIGLLALLMAIYFIGNDAVSLWDRDEPRYAQASRQMLESGDWTTPRLLDELRLKKPPLIYWLQATAMRFLGHTAFSARLPSVLATGATLLLLIWAIGRAVDPRTAWWTALIYGSTGLTIAAAKMSITDAVLTLFILIAQACVFRLWQGCRDWVTFILLGLSIGLAGLTKGPVVLGVLGTTLFVLWIMRWWFGETDRSVSVRGTDVPVSVSKQSSNWLMITQLLAVVSVVAAVVLPWIIALESAHPGAIRSMLQNEVLNRMAKPQEGHTGPPGFYLLAVWGTFFPWSLLLPAALVEAWRCRNDPAVRFALAAIVGPWIMFEAVATKLPHYVLPTYAALAFLTARVLLRAADGLTIELWQKHWPAIAWAWAGVVAIVGLFPWLGVYFFGPLPGPALVGSVLVSVWAVTFGAMTARHFARQQQLTAAKWMAGGILGVFALCYTLVFPFSPYLNLSRRAAAELPAGLRVGEAIMIDYKEASLAFYQGGTIRPESHDDYLAKVDPSSWPIWIVTTGDVWQTVPAERKTLLETTKTLTGWNYADGNRRVDLLILRRR